MKKYALNFGIICGISALTLCLLLKGDTITQLKIYLFRIRPLWIMISFICIILYWFFETLVQHQLVKKMCEGRHFWNSFKVVMTGHFFNAITPFASGGQPMQAVTMVQQGVPIGVSASILLSKFIVYQSILTMYSFIVLLLELKFFIHHVSGLIYLSLLGFSVNFIVVLALFGAALMKQRVKRVGFWILNLLSKLHLIKHTTTHKRNLIKQVDLFHDNIQGIQKNKGLLIRIIGLTFLQLTVYFLIPFAVYRALGLTGTGVFLMISAAAFIVMISSFIPVPGGSGIAEGSFFLFFQLFFPRTLLPIAILCWRIITFYVPLCFGAVMTMLPNYKNKCMLHKHKAVI